MIKNKRFKSIDIIKGIAMIMIIITHVAIIIRVCDWLGFLAMGCPMFFAASGFGIMCLISNKYNGSVDKDNIIPFYRSRLRALAPGWYATIILVFIENLIAGRFITYTHNFVQNTNILAILCNVFFLNGIFAFCNNNVIPGGWYIGATVLLYAFTPLILKCLHKFKNRKVFFIVSVAVVMAVWVVCYIVFHSAFATDNFRYFNAMVHYPSYLLGIMLYYDLDEDMLSKAQIKRCLPLGILFYIVAFIISNFPIPQSDIVISWMVALATYLVLYYMISNENTDPMPYYQKVLTAFGKNSYFIYLIHTLFAWNLLELFRSIFEAKGLNINTYFWLILLSLLVIVLSYYSGILLRDFVRFVTAPLFSKKKK